jgi:hypothetical protein
MQASYLVAIALIASTAVGLPSGVLAAQQSPQSDTTIVLWELGGGFGGPTYCFALSSTGQAVYQGGSSVPIRGRYETVHHLDLRRWVLLLADSGFTELPDRLPIAIDAPTTRLGVSAPSGGKTVEFDDAPDWLLRLRFEITQAASGLAWRPAVKDSEPCRLTSKCC